MRIDSVTAHAFGPLAGQSLSLAPGMTVISGANESAKSSWHAALFAAACGRRRGRGAGSREDRHFADLHRPWDGGEWRVSAMVALDDGRRIELDQDLGGRVNCRAVDLITGADVSNEIMYEGSPDASRWLGLDRRSFAATACINQAELLSILAVADGLQEQLQRAAATAGTDATAAAALDRIAAFAREHVGLDRPTSVRPLRCAVVERDRAMQALEDARRAHADYLDLVAHAQDLRARAVVETGTVRNAEGALKDLEALHGLARGAADAQAAADRAGERFAELSAGAAAATRVLAQVTELDARFGGRPPAGFSEAAQLGSDVAAALARWQAAEAPTSMTGQTSQQLRAQLAALPADPAGDLLVAESVRVTAVEWEGAVAVLAAHDDREPDRGLRSANAGAMDDESATALQAAIAAGPTSVRELAAALDTALHADDTTRRSWARVRADHEPARIEEANERAAAAEAQTVARRTAETVQAAEQTAMFAAAVTEANRRATTQPAATGRAGSRWRSTGGLGSPLLIAAGVLSTLGVVLVLLGLPVPGLVALAAVVATLAAGAVLRVFARRVPRPVEHFQHLDGQRAPAGHQPVIDAEFAPGQLEDDPSVALARRAADEARTTAAHAQSLAIQASSRVVFLADQEQAARAAAAQAEARLVAVQHECRERGLPCNSHALRMLAEQAEAAGDQEDQWAAWLHTRSVYEAAVQTAEHQLRTALVERGTRVAEPAEPVRDILDNYEQACRERSVQAQAAAGRGALQGAFADRLRAEQAYDTAERTRWSAGVELADIAHRVASCPGDCGADSWRAESDADLTGLGPTAVAAAATHVRALTGWRSQRDEQFATAQRDAEAWATLQHLCAGQTLVEMTTSVEQWTAAAAAAQSKATAAIEAAEMAHAERDLAADLAAGIAEVDVIAAADADIVGKWVQVARHDLADHRAVASTASAAAESLEGELRERARTLHSVPEAEEAFARANAELDRVEELSDTLKATSDFLTAAQDRVHRSIAPVLAATLQRWLPRVTAGRYLDAIVDPKTLQVQVCGPDRRWRQADLLSLGTAEQIYLLLRVALAQHLTLSGERCPLVLDDVTVQADADRTAGILDLLLELSADRQVILFAQEPAVAAWAAEHLVGGDHALRLLQPIGSE